MGEDIANHITDNGLISKVYKKVLITTNHQGNVNQNLSEISPYTCQMGCYQKDNK